MISRFNPLTGPVRPAAAQPRSSPEGGAKNQGIIIKETLLMNDMNTTDRALGWDDEFTNEQQEFVLL